MQKDLLANICFEDFFTKISNIQGIFLGGETITFAELTSYYELLNFKADRHVDTT